MKQTVISSAFKGILVGQDQPFRVIGERINPTGRPLMAAEMLNGDYSRVEQDTINQVKAGADMLDVNAGIPLADEPKILAECIQLIQSLTDLPLCINSSIIKALEAGLEVYKGKALVNSVTGEDEHLVAVLPLVKKHNAAVIAISNDETGISGDPDERFLVAQKIIERADDFGIKREDILVDPLAIPVGAINSAGISTFKLIQRLTEELNVNVTCGASNISFGLPNRNPLNAAFICMRINSGMTSTILNPLHAEKMTAIYGANIMMGNDPNCENWIKSCRQTTGETAKIDRKRKRRRSIV